jgi:UDP-N-acetylmuramate dehydrogenase
MGGRAAEEVRENVILAPYTSFHIGGPAAFFVSCSDEAGMREAAAFARARQLPLRILGAGTNILVPDEGVRAVVLHMRIQGITFAEEDGATTLVAGAGEAWDAVVDAAAARGESGIENLAGIPGTVGGAVVQNIGAYGAELSSAFLYADVYDAAADTVLRVPRDAAAFAYRDSVFKQRPCWSIVRAAFRVARGNALRTGYADLVRAAERGVPLDTPAAVASAVRGVRRGKFPNPALLGTAGSFFKNPLLTPAAAEALSKKYPELPLFPQDDGRVKVPLAWILDRVLSLKGFRKGSTRAFEMQPLVLVAEQGASARDVMLLAREITEHVFTATGIEIEREVEIFS